MRLSPNEGLWKYGRRFRQNQHLWDGEVHTAFTDEIPPKHPNRTITLMLMTLRGTTGRIWWTLVTTNSTKHFKYLAWWTRIFRRQEDHKMYQGCLSEDLHKVFDEIKYTFMDWTVEGRRVRWWECADEILFPREQCYRTKNKLVIYMRTRRVHER